MGKSSYTGIVILIMIQSFYFGLMSISNNAAYNLCLEDEEKFFTDNPDMNLWGIYDMKECNNFKDLRDIFLLISMPLVLIAGTKQQHNKWNNSKEEMLKEYNPSQPPLFYIVIALISMIIFVIGIYTLLTTKSDDWILLIGIFTLPFVSSGILSSALRRYWVLKEKMK